MKKIMIILSLLTLARAAFAENLLLENQTSYPNQKSKIAIQWAATEKEVEESNHAVIYGLPLNQNSLQVLSQTGKITLNIPKTAEYFRVLVWSNGAKEPDLLTNWVDIVPNKTYTLQTDHLVPAVLISGIGC